MTSSLIICSSPNYLQEAIKISKFSPTNAVLMGSGALTIPCRQLRLPSSSASKVAMVTMQAPKVENAIMVGDIDFDILELLQGFSIPIYVHYVRGEKRVGYMLEGEDF